MTSRRPMASPYKQTHRPSRIYEQMIAARFRNQRIAILREPGGRFIDAPPGVSLVEWHDMAPTWRTTR